MYLLFIQNLNQIFEAGIAITSLSLFFRSLSFNLNDRVSRAFAILLACVMIVFSGEAINGAVEIGNFMVFSLKAQWVGILFFPAALVHFSDALMATTGQPSRGRRSKVVAASYIISSIFFLLLVFGYLLGEFIQDGPVPHLERTIFSTVFIAFYLLGISFSLWTIWRAYQRTKLSLSRRRMWYLMSGVFLLALGTYPYLQIGSGLALLHPVYFLSIVTAGNMAVFVFLVMMAYSVAFFGIPWPDRIIRSRLLKWFLRGPATVFVVLFIITFLRSADRFSNDLSEVWIPIATAVTVLFFEHLITLVFPSIERIFFSGGDHAYLELLKSLSERLITKADLNQFLESVLAAACDQLQVTTAFIAAFSENGIQTVVQVGDKASLESIGMDESLLEKVSQTQPGRDSMFAWGKFWLFPLHSQQNENFLGLLGILKNSSESLEDIELESIKTLVDRSEMALEDRNLQQQVLAGLEELAPKVNVIQQLRAAARYDQQELLKDIEDLTLEKDLNQLVKDALTHYWGGPKLSESPLMKLHIVQEAIQSNQGNPVNALRAILKDAVDRVKPEGDRRFTAEWILYNILEMKFMEGRKVREIAKRLAMSEADLYRKQRIAIEEVSKVMMDMEQGARNDSNGGGDE